MFVRPSFRHFGIPSTLTTLVVAACLIGGVSLLKAGLLATRSVGVGGVSIDVKGIVALPQVSVQRELQAARQRALTEIPGDLMQPVELRKVSLRRLDEALRKHRTSQFMPLPDDMEFLAGLQRIEYLFVFPEQHDIVLAGPAEGWRVDALGNVVGKTSGRPVLLLDDLLVALRTARDVSETGITCSIDPTPEGIQQVRGLVRRLKGIGNPRETASRIEEALGPQVVTVRGVPTTTHFARVMVAADYRMKRLAMNLDTAPIANLPSYLHLVGAGRGGMQMPRWWLAPKYEPLLTDADGLSWEIQAGGVQCLTEDDIALDDGTRRHTGKSSTPARRWANNMTEHYDQLAAKDSAFALLHNIIDLAVIGALVEKEKLLERAGVELPYLMGEEQVSAYYAPKQVASQASLIRKGRRWVVSASGGVEIYPRQLLDAVDVSDSLAPVRDGVDTSEEGWWWN
ncbi:MAG: DUF1598 domain-containing protein [Pirellulales bacterium]